MRRTLKLFVIRAGKPAGSPPEPGPDIELEAASDDAFLGAAQEAIAARELRARAVSFTPYRARCVRGGRAVTTPRHPT